MVMVGKSNKRATDQLTIESAESTDKTRRSGGWAALHLCDRQLLGLVVMEILTNII